MKRLAMTLAAVALAAGAIGAHSQASEPAFLGEADAPRIDSLREVEVDRVVRGKGGRSLAFKIWLSDGTVGYFKPAQSFSAAHWYSELAAYYLDRELGLGRVPPTVGRVFAWQDLRRAAGGDPRIKELAFGPDKTLKGAFIWWVPQRLARLRLGRQWERWVRVQRTLPITPYQRPVDYRADLNGRSGTREATDPDRPLAGPAPDNERAAELSDLIVFDYLTQNVDRWGGGFTNVRTREEDGPLIYLDNGAGFWLGQQRLGLMEARLKALQKFRLSTVEAVRNLDIDAFAARLASDPLAPILNEKQLAGLRKRQKAFLAHVDRMVARFGEAEVLAW
ncbi:MAG: hypothetical protein AAF500_10910 [Myxococcota bacterium]